MSKDDRTMLRFDWEEIEDREVTAILGHSYQALIDGTASWEAIALVIDGQAVMIDVDTNTDELVVSLGQPPMGEDWRTVTALSESVGKRLGWCWIGRNYRGYLDSFTVAFNGIDPTCMFVGIGSTIWIKKVSTAYLA